MEAQQQQSSTNPHNKGKSRFYGGRVFYPHDIYYDPKAKEALTKLRQFKRDDMSNNGGKEVLHRLESSGVENAATLTLIGYKGGTLESQINQDRAMVISPYYVGGEMNQSTKQSRRKPSTVEEKQQQQQPPSQLLGVFDGHARLGEKVSEYAVSELPNVLAAKLDKIDPKDDPEQVKEAIIDTFIEIDKTAPAEISGGCTASVILRRGSKLYVANAGDSRSFVVVYRASTQSVEIIYISREDKPHLPDERKRVEECGGEVYLPPLGTSRVLYTDPDSGLQSGLAMSRSIGDWEVGKTGVIPDPLVEIIDIDQVVESQLIRDCLIPEEDASMNASCYDSKDDVHIFAVSATDGLMDFASSEVIAQAVAFSLYHKDGPHLLSALEQLIYMAAGGWERAKAGRYRDDICVSVAEIRTPRKKTSQ
jgi:serine/threonine protein phosphatase PrpC